uniref:Zinc finger protein 800 n=1 Tax=Cacopsylla melanoneura TaxID=428564 RepID=A0A8D8WF20_9HEMI
MKPTPHQVNNVRSNVNRSRKKKKRVINDESIMNIAMASTANDLVHVSELLNSGTKEIQDVLKLECALIYECKVCRGLFRSIINFVIHKRKYCVTKFSTLNHENLSSKLQQVESLFKTTLSSSNNAESGQGKPMRTIQPPTLSSFYQSLISKTLGSVSPDGKSLPSDILKMQSATVVLDKLENTFFTKPSSNTTDHSNSELSSLINDSSTAVLREDGTIATNIQSLGQLYQNNFNSCSSATNSSQPNDQSQQPSSRLSCSLCKYTCEIRSSLYHHLQSKHFTWYKCDECLKSYNSLRIVLRHLNEVHHISRTRVEQRYKKKVLANKVVKSVPKHLYCPSAPSSTPSTTSISAPTPIPSLSSCTKCSSLLSSSSFSSTLCSSCASGSDNCSVKSDELSSRKAHASFLLQGCSNRVVPSPASSCAGDIPSPGSPAVRLSCEENKNKAGIQVRMNYDKCTPGNPIVSKIVSERDQISPDTPTLTQTLSPSSDSKENTQQNGENENKIGRKEKRKNLDSITQKLLSNKMADDTTCTEIKLSCSPLFNRNRGNNKNRKSVRKMGLETPLLPIVQLDSKPEISSELKQDTNKTSDKGEKGTLVTPGEPKRRTRQRSLEKTVTMEITRRSLRDTSSSSNKSGDFKVNSLIRTPSEQDNSLDVKVNGVNHSEGTDENRKRKLRARSDIANKKSKSSEDVSNDVNNKSSDDVQVLETPKVLHGSCESLEDTLGCSENEQMLKCIMKDAMDTSSNTCKVCTISFLNKKLLRIHVASRHVGYYRYRCAVESCNKMYFSQSDATQHARTSHANQKEDVIRVDASTLSMSSALEVQGVLKNKK